MDIKEAVSNVIRNKKVKMDKEYDDIINGISAETNPVKIYSLLAQTDTIHEDNIGVDVLKEILTNAFFKEATIDNGVNYITFSNDKFDIMFSKFLSREIKIKYKNPYQQARYYRMLNSSRIKLADLIEIYLNKKSFSNFKALVDYNCIGYRNETTKITKYIRTYKRCNKELLNSIRNKQKQDIIHQAEADEENKKYEEAQLHAKTFIESLTDLTMFKDAGWYISTNGIGDKNSYFE